MIDERAPSNEGNVIVLKNMKPRAWVGRPYNFGLYKNGKLLQVQSDVGVGSQAVFQMTPKLFFGVVKDIKIGTVFKSLSTTQSYFSLDLNNYANGVIVILEMNEASGEYYFRAEQDEDSTP